MTTILHRKNTVLLLTLCLTGMASYAGSTRRRYGREKDDVLEQGTRNAIYELIMNNEGLHFRKICRILDKKMGVVQYHVSVLEKNGLIRSLRDGRYKCFFATQQPTGDGEIAPDDRDLEMESMREKIITSLRRKTPQVLISHLIDSKVASHQTLSNIASVSPQAITFHTQRLQGFGILESSKEGRQKFYRLSDSAKIITDRLMERANNMAR